MSNAPIYLVSVPRSGATLLGAMLNSHKNIAMFNEPWFSYMLPKFESLCRRGQAKSLVNDLNNAAGKFGVTLDTEFTENVIAEINGLNSFNPIDVFVLFMSRYANRMGKRRWGIKQPFGIFYVPQLLKRLPDLKILHIVRDPRATVAERIGKESDEGEDLVNVLKFSRSCSKMMRFANHVRQLNPENYCELRYEDFVSAPEVYLNKVCECVGEDYDPGMLEYYKAENPYVPREKDGSPVQTHLTVITPVNAGYIGVWKNLLTLREIAIVERVCHQAMVQRGYYPITCGKEIDAILYLKTAVQFWWTQIRSFVKHGSFERILYKFRNGLVLYHN